MQRKHIVLSIVGGVIVFIFLPLIVGGLWTVFSGNDRKPQQAGAKKKLAVWTMYDAREVYDSRIQAFLAKHPDFTVEYRRYTDPNEYRDLLIDQIAEGKGPDVAALPNEWVYKDRFKFRPYTGTTIEAFEKTFVGSAVDELILPDAQGEKRIYGIPAFTDNLALYYNKRSFRDYVLGSNQPAGYWETQNQDDLLRQVIKLTQRDLSLEQFLVSGIALGRTDNILRGMDVFLLFLLQHGAQLTDDAMKSAAVVTQRPFGSGQQLPPFVQALKFFTSFAVGDFQQYSWNDLITKREFDEYELGAFATGKTAMFYGYASDYPKILTSIRGKGSRGRAAIDPDDVGVLPVPQLSNASPAKFTLARYAPFMVPVTSKYPDEAWELILSMIEPEYQQATFEKHHRISSLASLLEKQALDPIYGVFASQASYARTLRLSEPEKMRAIFDRMILSVVNDNTDPNAAAIAAAAKLQCVLDQVNQVAGREDVDCLKDSREQ